MTSKNSLLGRSRPTERLSKKDREALERAVGEPAPTPRISKEFPAETQTPSNSGKEARIERHLLRFHWTTDCPACGFKVSGSGNPQPGQRLARCGRCKLALFLKGN